MLLTRLKSRLDRARDDEGAALVSVIGIMAIMLIIAMMIANASVTATAFSSTTRAQVQARAAADAGIDLVWAGLQQGTFHCGLATTTPTGMTFAADVKYYDAAGAQLSCFGASTLSGNPVKGVVTSTGTATNKGIGGAKGGDVRTIIALFDIEVNPGSVNLDKVVFADANYTLTNNTKVIDATGLNQANLYSNGNVDCKTNVPIQGWVLVQGNFDAPNTCAVTGTVWAGGAVTSPDQLTVSGDILSAGGTGPSPSTVSLDKTWVGGSVVANGSVSLNTPSNSQFCSVHGYSAKVCGSIVSIDGGVVMSNGARVGGSVMARNTVDIGTTNNVLMVGGNVVSTTGNLAGSNFGNTGSRVGGYVALGGSTSLPIDRVGNKPSSCASGSAGYRVCTPAQPPLSLSALPGVLNFPTNSRVVAPPREALPRIDSDAVAMTKWAGWNVENVTCANLMTRIGQAWVGKLLLNVTGCTTPVPWNNLTITLPGDLVIINPAGFAGQNDVKVKSSVVGTSREFMLIVPSDAKLPSGSPLVNWTAPIASDPNYTKPVCVPGDYGDITSSKFTFENIKTFFYTPCDFAVTNDMTGFSGQFYTGTSVFPNNSTIVFSKLNVPGATVAGSVAAYVTATPTARFDARG